MWNGPAAFPPRSPGRFCKPGGRLRPPGAGGAGWVSATTGALVVGGSVGGLAAAIELRRAAHADVAVYERSPGAMQAVPCQTRSASLTWPVLSETRIVAGSEPDAVCAAAFRSAAGESAAAAGGVESGRGHGPVKWYDRAAWFGHGTGGGRAAAWMRLSSGGASPRTDGYGRHTRRGNFDVRRHDRRDAD